MMIDRSYPLDFVAPVELVGFPRSKAQRDIGRSRRLPVLLGPSPGIAAQRVVAALVNQFVLCR